MVTFQDVEQVYARWLNLDHDPDLIRIIFSVVLANRYDGSPVWIMLVGPSGGGKTASIKALEDAEECYTISSLTPTSLASGSTGGGILDEINNKVMIVRDFSTISSMDKTAKTMLYSFLREAYDGEFSRMTGRSKQPIRWAGRFGLIGCTTPQAAEDETAKQQELGERFITIRMKRLTKKAIDEILEAKFANSMHQKQMSEELRNVGRNFLHDFVPMDVVIDDPFKHFLTNLARIMAKCRTPVDRDRISKAIELPVPDTQEVPSRLLGQIKAIAVGLLSMGTTMDDTQRIMCRIAADSMPIIRLRCLEQIKAKNVANTNQFAKAIGVSHQTASHAVEDLDLLDIIDRTKMRIKFPGLVDIL